MKKILVTGGGGYIGTTLVPLLLNKGYKVKVFDRFFFGEDLLSPHENLELVYGDIRLIKERDFANVDAVIDLAALSNDPSGELFQNSTYEINHKARVNVARIAKKIGVDKYILPSSCSIYGFLEEGMVADEQCSVNPLTTYAKANYAAENDILDLSDKSFCAVVIRQATVYGFSPRMRFDLAINGMTYGAWKNKLIPLMREGKQWRPMVHVKDTSQAMIFMLENESKKINGQIFNVGSDKNNYQIGNLAKKVASQFKDNVKIEWYGDPDHRSYRINFDKIERLGFKAKYSAEDGIREISQALEKKITDKTIKTITLDWYQEIIKWNDIINKVGLNKNIINL